MTNGRTELVQPGQTEYANPAASPSLYSYQKSSFYVFPTLVFIPSCDKMPCRQVINIAWTKLADPVLAVPDLDPRGESHAQYGVQGQFELSLRS